MNIKEIQQQVHQSAVDHGWWEKERNFGESLALVHSEVSEALEEWRNGRGISEIYLDDKGHPCGIPIEFADILIRVLDLAEYYQVDMELALRAKIVFNGSRPYRHGGKKA